MLLSKSIEFYSEYDKVELELKTLSRGSSSVNNNEMITLLLLFRFYESEKLMHFGYLYSIGERESLLEASKLALNNFENGLFVKDKRFTKVAKDRYMEISKIIINDNVSNFLKTELRG